MNFVRACWIFALCGTLSANAAAQEPITFNTNFEGASLARVEVLGVNEFRCHVEGQQNAFGRNRQPTWYSFRMDGVRGRALTLTLTGFIGEYNERPAVAMSAELRPVFSSDGEIWTHFPEADWNAESKEMTLRITPESDSLHIAHVPPYTHSRLLRLLGELEQRSSAIVEVIGKTALGRELHQVTVTASDVNDVEKRCAWLQARQHAWEAGTSWVMEGALRFITSDDPAAVKLRERVIFKFTPMLDPDGCALGKVRFNANGFDVNRHWDEVDLRSRSTLQRMPEIWYAKKAILAWHRSRPIDLMVNMHNTETAEYLDTLISEEAAAQRVVRLFSALKERTSFEPSRVPTFGASSTTANHLWTEAQVPIVLMEQRISGSQKLGRFPTTADRLEFGRALLTEMAAAVLAEPRR